MKRLIQHLIAGWAFFSLGVIISAVVAAFIAQWVADERIALGAAVLIVTPLIVVSVQYVHRAYKDVDEMRANHRAQSERVKQALQRKRPELR